MNQRGRQPMGMDSRTLVIAIVIIGIIGYLLFPSFFKAINFSTDPTLATTSLNNVNLPSTNDPNALSSATSSSQLFPSGNNTMNIGSGNNAISTGNWILFLSNGTFQQLSVNAQNYAFVQGLIQSDSKGSTTVTIYLIDNGQVHQYNVSNETYSVITNMASINARASNVSPNASTNSSTPPVSTPPTTTLSTTAISEILTVSNPSTTGFRVALNPALNGLTSSNFTIFNSTGNPVAITGAATSDNGATYAITAAFSAGQTYILTASDAAYTFGTAQNVLVPQ